MAPALSPNQSKHVLVIDGGGFRGLGSLLVLQELMKMAESRARQSLLPCDVFDLICGTSTGGLIATLLGRLGLDCATAIDIYKELTIAICGTNEAAFWEDLLKSNDGGLKSAPFERSLAKFIEKYTGLADTPMALKGDRDVVDHPKTNAFVTVTSEAPLYDNRTHCIRSYASRSRQPPPSEHQWSIREAVRGTLGSTIFLSPLSITSKYSYGDAGFAGFSSPVAFVPKETQALWPSGKIGTITVLGPGLSSLAPSSPRREWAVTDSYAKKYVDKIMVKLQSQLSAQDTLRLNAVNLVKQFVTLAVDTELLHSEFTANRQTHCTRLCPPLGIDNIDLVDCFHADVVEKAVKKWLQDEGKHILSAIACNLVELKKEPISTDDARFVIPPSPPPNTNPGYNPRLDERRPETMIEYLKNYRVCFIIDDSGSMEGERWSETRDALLEIAEHALRQNVDEIDMMFLNHHVLHRAVKGASTILKIFDAVRPAGYTPTGATLQKVLDEHMTKLDLAVNTPQYSTIKPLDIIVITDGVPTDRPKDVLVNAVARMKHARHHPNAMGVQIVQVGDDPEAVPALKDLMLGDVGSMVDTVPYKGKLTPQRQHRAGFKPGFQCNPTPPHSRARTYCAAAFISPKSSKAFTHHHAAASNSWEKLASWKSPGSHYGSLHQLMTRAGVADEHAANQGSSSSASYAGPICRDRERTATPPRVVTDDSELVLTANMLRIMYIDAQPCVLPR
ncbi:putative von Willebrand factor type A domain [Lyophyllum shimeji]|uniref:von Willebrand factor type A domain n=1 Tax=Lyophyllum shimeji TaxID=47721 RepID=A0A9P3PZS6_LYOSH|nr:putative von Willebrand factor type A domain [Lyophyllum shimeji]